MSTSDSRNFNKSTSTIHSMLWTRYIALKLVFLQCLWCATIKENVPCHLLTFKSSPATRHGGAWGERRYSSYTFTTSALEGVSGQRHAPAALYPRYPLYRRWAPEPVWTQRLEEKNPLSCRGSNPDRPVVQPVVRHYTVCVTEVCLAQNTSTGRATKTVTEREHVGHTCTFRTLRGLSK
jgi:hypothetical protein